jgi:hypothetical protein
LSGPLRSILRSELGRTAHRQALRKTSLLEEDKAGELRAASKAVLDRQTRAALGPAASQDLPAVLCAHAFSESVFALFFEVRRLLKRKRHTNRLSEQISNEGRIIGTTLPPVKPRGLSTC